MLEIKGLSARVRARNGSTEVLSCVDLEVRSGQIVGLVGESGSGKSLTCRAILRAMPPNIEIASGAIRFGGIDLCRLDVRAMRRVRGREIAMILQNPMTSLNPVMRVGEQVAEPIMFHGRVDRATARSRALEALRSVRIPDPERNYSSFPHQLSGGMRQRVSGAIAISCQPRLLIADEPTTALDATVQAEYLALLQDIQKQTGVAILLVTHDLSVVASVCDHVAVMYAGRIVECGAASEIFDSPRHPYTQALLRVLRVPVSRRSRVDAIGGAPPSPGTVLSGCPFAARCPQVMDECSRAAPPEIQVTGTHRVSCWRHAA